MIMDMLLSIVAMCGFLAFLVVVGWYVREPDLIIVFILGGGMAIFDFVRSLRRRRNNNG